MKFYGEVENGKLRIYHRAKFDEFIKGIEGHVTISVSNKKENRSDQQNRYWWVLVTILAGELGYEKEEFHEILKYKFLKKSKVDHHTGEIYEYLESSAKLDKEEFGTLIENLHRWSADTFGIVLPEPFEQLKIV